MKGSRSLLYGDNVLSNLMRSRRGILTWHFENFRVSRLLEVEWISCGRSATRRVYRQQLQRSTWRSALSAQAAICSASSVKLLLAVAELLSKDVFSRSRGKAAYPADEASLVCTRIRDESECKNHYQSASEYARRRAHFVVSEIRSELGQLVRQGAQQMWQSAIEAEVETFLQERAEGVTREGLARVRGRLR